MSQGAVWKKAPKALKKFEGGTGVSILVQPKAKKNETSGRLDGRLKIRLTAPPMEGKANKALPFLPKPSKFPNPESEL